MALDHAGPGEVVDLNPLGLAIASSKTSALVKTDRFEAVRLVVLAGTMIPSHQVSGYFTLLCLEGRVVLGPDETCCRRATGSISIAARRIRSGRSRIRACC